MSAQRASSVVGVDHLSIHPNVRGVPWWIAVLIATGTTAIGYAIDAGSGHKALTHVFAVLYVAGCLAAVLGVRQSDVFTAVIQPPLILFCTVPGAYWLFHAGKVSKLKDLLINCGYPLIERFPLMVGTAGAVLLIGLIRWYLGMSRRGRAAESQDNADMAVERTSGFSGMAERLASLFFANSDDEADEIDDAHNTASPRIRAAGRSSRTGRAPRSSRSTRRTSRTHSRHTLPPLDGALEPRAERTRRENLRASAAAHDFDAVEPTRRSRRRPRPDSEPDLRTQSPREARGGERTRRTPYDHPRPRRSSFDSYEKLFEPHDPPSEPSGRYERYGATYEPYRTYDPYEQPHRRGDLPGPGPSSANPTHHPISQVRYRGQMPRDDYADYADYRAERRDEPHGDRRNRSRAPRRPPAESWEYDA